MKGEKSVKIFISQPMRFKSNKQIAEEREQAEAKVREKYGDDAEIIDSFFQDADHEGAPVKCLAHSIELLAQADAAIFLEGWRSARGCRIEHDVCLLYGIPIEWEADEKTFGEVMPVTRLMENVRSAVAEAVGDIMAQRGRGFASDKEAWADLKQRIEDVKEAVKHAESTHKEMWDAAKENDGNAFNALAQEFERAAVINARKWAEAGAYAKIALECVEEK